MANLASLIITILTKSNTSGLEKTDRAIRKTKTSLKGMQKDIGLFSSLSRKLFGGISLNTLIDAGGRYLQFEKDLGAIHSRFFAITKDEQKATEEFDYIRKVARDTANDIKATADSYSIFYSATSKSLGKEGAREVFENWTRVGRVLHLSEYQMERVTYALREMASKGAIYSQDLRMQIGTHVPNAMGLAQKAAEEMGFTGNDWFEKLQKSAKGNAKITTEFVRRFSKQARQMFGNEEAFKKAMQQPDALAQQIKNFQFEFGYKFSKAGGSYMVVKILQGILNSLEKIPFDRITEFLGQIARVIGKISNYLPEIARLLWHLILIYGAQQLVGGLNNFAGKMTGGKGFFGSKGALAALGLNLKYLFRGGFFAGLGNIFRGALLSLRNIWGKALILGFGKSLSKFIPIVGNILIIIDILRVVAKLLNLKFGNKDKNMFGEYFLDTGYKTDYIRKSLEAIQSRGIQNRDELAKQLSYFGLKKIEPYVDVDTQNNIHVFIDGKDIPFSQITSAENNKKPKKGKIPAKPHKLTQDELKKLGI